MEDGTITRNIFGVSRKEAEAISFRATKADYSISTVSEAKLIGKEKGKKFDEFNPSKEQDDVLLIKKIEGPFDENNKKVNVVEKGTWYTYKITQFNRTPKEKELKNIKWASQYDDGAIKEIKDVTNKGYKEIKHMLKGDNTSTKLRIYAFCKASNKQVSVEAEIKVLEPIIIYVCGYWNKLMPYAGTEWGQEYWGTKLKQAAKGYFKAPKEYFINGAGTKFSSGGGRFKQGKEFADARYKNVDSKFYKEIFKEGRRIMILSHSMGGAFSEGLLSVMKSHNVKVEKVVHLSPADTSGFSVNFPDRTYQIDIDWDPVLMYKNADDAPIIKGIKFAGLVKNPKKDEFGHMYTKDEAFVWKWFEDLEAVNFVYNRSEKKYMRFPSDGLGPATTSSYDEKIYKSSGLKNNTQFQRVIKGNDTYHYHALNEYETYDFKK
ncbi:hypothetical protein [Flavobacterium sp. '19STA2R22 D10 B1']|uniref:hypothetical protein n=1 Tax=Flavobacterium aerium TaxID=3037261 RepID=UPI00278BD9A5|nr:hypothetical protein [Flavobacterium sp. '19STA2R22 D10 B1']